MTEKLLTYALGRGLEYYDMPTARCIVRETAPYDGVEAAWCGSSQRFGANAIVRAF